MRYMIKDEGGFHTEAMKWLKYNLDSFPRSFKIETKVARRGCISFPYNELSEKEERLLLRAKHKSVIQTNSDYGGLGTNCDADVVGGGGFIFIKWIRPRNNTFYIIDIDDFIKQRDGDARKSMLEETAKQLAYKVGTLK